MKRLLAIIGTVICVVFMGGCAEVCLGLPILFCGVTCAQCSRGTYPFMHEMGSLDEVRIELVELSEGIYNGTAIEEIRNGMNPVAQVTDKDKFIEELLDQTTVIPFGDPGWFLSGKAICLTYPDGQIELITEDACALVSDEARIIDRNFINDTFEPFWDKWAQS